MKKFEFIKSIRFWKITLAAGVEILALFGVLPVDVAHVIALWLGADVTIHTVDKIAK